MRNVPRNEIINIISEQTDVLVSTSTSETFGLSMLEALMCGVPVIATNSGGNQEFLTTSNSILIENKDYNALADAILKIKNGNILVNKQFLRESGLNKFGVKPFVERFRTHLEDTLNPI